MARDHVGHLARDEERGHVVARLEAREAGAKRDLPTRA